MGILQMVGRTLLAMLMKMATKEMVSYLVLKAAEMGVDAYEEKAAKTPEKDDDKRAKHLREVYEKAKEAME